MEVLQRQLAAVAGFGWDGDGLLLLPEGWANQANLFFSPIEGERARFRLFTDDDRSQASKPSFIQFL